LLSASSPRFLPTTLSQGSYEVAFRREELVAAAEALGESPPKNLGDVVYSLRYRVPLPDSVREAAPPNTEWAIFPGGNAVYVLRAVPFNLIEPRKGIRTIRLPDSTPGVIAKYAMSDEQARSGQRAQLGSVSIMGYWKNRSIEEGNQGWEFTDGSVCGGCVEDDALRTILRENEDADLRCDFCSSVPAAHLDTLVEAFVNGLRNEYENALEGVSWDGREGGFQWHSQWDTWELVGDFHWVFSSEELLETVAAAVHHITWVEKDFITRRRDDVLIEAWDRFCEAVKHKTRFVVWLLQPDDDDLAPGEIPPAKILEHVTSLIERLNLVRDLPAGHRVWRAHTYCTSPAKRTASDLGTVPKGLALKANRMSPAGIPMFYGAVDADTAITEVAYASDDTHVTWCQFELTADLRVVDLTRLPPEPSMFDPKLGSVRRQIRFLDMFVQQLSDRVEPEHGQIDYVPTQIVTEYLLHFHGGGDRVRGLVYESSLADGSCVALDIPNAHCIDPGTSPAPNFAQLQLVADSIGSDAITVATARRSTRPS